MKLYLDCIQCVPRQALQAARFCGASEDVQERILRRTLKILMDDDWNCSPMEIVTPVLEMIREECGVDDPYAEVKRISNREAEQHTGHVLEKIANSPNPFQTALKAAIGGNIIDYGAGASFDLDATMDRVFSMDFAVDDEEKLVEAIAKAGTIAYLADNAGEIVFDRILIEVITQIFGEKEFLFVVRDRPFINDATRFDTVEVGLDKIDAVEIVGMPPRIPDPFESSHEVWKRVLECDIVISKGQGNYEAFSGRPGIFFLLMAKCELVARDINERTDASVKLQDMVLWQSVNGGV